MKTLALPHLEWLGDLLFVAHHFTHIYQFSKINQSEKYVYHWHEFINNLEKKSKIYNYCQLPFFFFLLSQLIDFKFEKKEQKIKNTIY